jgi:hypothetical protein
MNQVLRLKGVKEFDHIGEESGPGNWEVLGHLVGDLINGMTLLQQLPNLQSDGIETEANPLLLPLVNLSYIEHVLRIRSRPQGQIE